MSSKLIPLTGKQKNVIHDLVDNPPLSPSFALDGPLNPHLRVFAVHFDGTKNNMGKAPPEDEQHSLVVDSYQHLAVQESKSLATAYYAGVGTQGFLKGLDSMIGFNCEPRAKQAYDDLCEMAAKWKLEDPLAVIHVHVVGFSRGSATALDFMNMVHEKGLRIASTRAAENRTLTPRVQASVGPGKVLSSAVLLDTVSTGQNDLDLTLPSTNVSTLHLTAGGEERVAFPLTCLIDEGRRDELALAKNVYMEGAKPGSDGVLRYKRMHQVEIPGARHSDVGGVYTAGNMRHLSRYLMTEFQRSLGLPVNCERPTFGQIEGMSANDSRWWTFFSNPEERLSVHRRAIHKDHPWDGTYLEVVTRHGSDAEPKVRVVESSPEQAMRGIRKEHLGQRASIEFWTSPGDRPGSVRLCWRSSPRDSVAFDVKSGLMTLHGVVIQAAPSLDELRAVLSKDGAARFHIDIGKGLPVFDARQDPVLAQTLDRGFKRRLVKEPWPEVIRQAIKRQREPDDSVDEHTSFYDCLDAAAETILASTPDVRAVSIEHMDVTPGVPWFRIKCERSDGSTFTIGGHVARGDVELSRAVKVATEALTVLADAMIERGIDVYRTASAVVHRSAEPSGSLRPPTIGQGLLASLDAKSEVIEWPSNVEAATPRLRLVSGPRM